MASETAQATAGTAIPVATDKYIKELDGIRAIAIGLVVLAHYGLGFVIPGAFGVTVFFFLSGYLITTLFYAEYRKSSGIDIPRFYLRRWLRLTPPLVILVLTGTIFYRLSRVAVDGTPVPVATTLAALLYYTNYHAIFWGLDLAKVVPFGDCWSLAIEEHFYLIWPWILRKTIANPRRLCAIIIGLCVAVLIWRIIAREVLSFSTTYTYMATDCRIDSILYGALLRALLETRWASAARGILRASACRGLALGALLATFLIRDDGFRETVRYSIQGLALMPFFMAAVADNPNTRARKLLACAPMVLIGRLSYSIYLFHFIVRTPGESYFGSPLALGSVISGLLFTAATALILYVFVERPIAGLRHRFRAGKGRVGLAGTPTTEPAAEVPLLSLPNRTSQ
jgi:peptidoglycan/LPS O-acetylase OafA/YrhL